jgi:hypothetical protein
MYVCIYIFMHTYIHTYHEVPREGRPDGVDQQVYLTQGGEVRRRLCFNGNHFGAIALAVALTCC